MELDTELVKNIAKVARLNLTNLEIGKLKKDLSDVLEAFSKIEEVNTENVKMSIQPVKLGNALREDVPKKCLTQEQSLSQTKNKQGGYFVGPKSV
ncbi:Asp-tRNA(Asn)/Glu-tRNA(Gln) amidotransferase subunit GatC [Candidatus Woesearchaeota archaeon]|jgi:aspartyl-tRNA(Asn)/glutamyl-tRNA(Gln) amidotransferase subunit C|nr:Asp-tRNA(Asn)/Glu-tRNA(Gln) amidotransferase subunit GatC [Candidatus Woesearchaeota archaeon]MBT4368091.1 Asp-tRNA(Asn)/Glu-tRNA(Gln) amidotransferase subunit GatC [Candidatus Woesearchaeota archaeon]MBT4712579.1 Asp-tRNA(Asn)/Glu-tRNA(Gln) amidotransferase subunit GatC [Candidatus Woesearchaeota archaeon]MBT6639492.1 Asp-tRNA(Asn)/Glu-tRNA(Gln) amidotransferase subunit GatC [Candidatus Woesearchaeota archaeon]MBT7133664.1 Asp-tRNA(Asn)/Glu-tRNA(Gln) amidotransferase subunit GatC [Candidatu